jgi:hypothetical protein
VWTCRNSRKYLITRRMAGHDPEKFDGMFLAMCQRSEKGIDEVE